MKVIVINLEKSHKRRELMQKQLKKQNFEYQIFPATDASNIDDVWINDNISEAFKKEYEKYKDRFITKGALGCSDSHRRVWEYIINNNCDDIYLILEDDCYLPPSSSDYIHKCAQTMLSLKYEFINLYYTNQKQLHLDKKQSTPIIKEYSIYSYPKEPTTSSVAYLISVGGAKKLLSSQQKYITRMADAWDFDEIQLNAGLVYPLLVLTAGFPSTIVKQSWKISLRRLLLNSILVIPYSYKVMVPYLRNRVSNVKVS